MSVEYYLHFQDYVAQCLNKDKPELNCDGTCILMQKLADVEEQKAEQNLAQLELFSLYVNSVLDSYSFQIPEMVVSEKGNISYLFFYSTPVLEGVFQPPIA